ncbi:DUF1048 domain-containing protein [Aeromicrobium phragmitis]|uniref:DUF1048 domain-containing protein n=1 Tax=Aeromicrobium phragmitis TaxID=2478914 RepID=A0A3L8PLV0_9ACTN|nr:DUF1048 domain-containing protein [Aeromicrobium phragmitis]RLV55508.1 DUF1048 domain-containing protein [Aeromicrobium phragmitis]
MTNFLDKVVGEMSDKRRWREYKARVKALPAAYGTAADGLERYLLSRGTVTRADALMSMLEQLADQFERAAADGRPIRAVVGADPVRYADDLAAAYADREHTDPEHQRLIATIAAAEAQQEKAHA